MKRLQITFLVDPSNFETYCLKAPLVSDEAAFELEMIELCEKDKLKPALREGTTEFWKSVPMEKYFYIKRDSPKVLSMFGSTYVCESVFFTLNHMKLRHRPVLTCTNQQPPQRGGAVPDPVWVGSKWLLDFPRVPVTPGTPLHFFAMLPPERPQEGNTQHLQNRSPVFTFSSLLLYSCPSSFPHSSSSPDER